MTLMWIVVGMALAAIVADWGYRRYASSRIRELIDNVPPFGLITSAPIETADVFTIPTTDDLHLTASLHSPAGPPCGLILFCPELHGSHWTVSNYCEGLITAGFAVLAFDFRNQGESEHLANYEPIHWSTEFELDDLNSVLKFIAGDDELNKLPLGAFGVSRGGSTALVAACRTQQIQSIVTDSAYDTMSLVQHFMHKFSRYVVPDWFFKRLPRWHVNWVLRQALRESESRRGRNRECRYLRLANEAHNFDQPVLLISGKRDSYVTPDVTEKLAGILGQAHNTWIVPKAKHNKSRSMVQHEYDQRIVNHFQQTLPDDHLKQHTAVQSTPAPQPGA